MTYAAKIHFDFVKNAADKARVWLREWDSMPDNAAKQLTQVTCAGVADMLRALVEAHELISSQSEAEGPKWRRVLGDELPSGPPVKDGTTLYTFDNFPGHWEYELPPVPTRCNAPSSEGSPSASVWKE